MNELGRAKRIIIDKDTCTIIEGAGKTSDIKGRIESIKNEIEATTSDYDREKLEERLAKLSGGVAQINVGAATEIEMKEKKARVEDALHACRAAVEEGILPGGGVAVLRCDAALDAAHKKARGDQKTGVDIVRRALRAPIKQIAENAGLDGSIVCQKVQTEKTGNFGYNALTEEYGDLIKMGVIVPLKVERVALENAASVASLLLTTDAVISEIKEKDDDKGGPGGMPGMRDQHVVPPVDLPHRPLLHRHVRHQLRREQRLHAGDRQVATELLVEHEPRLRRVAGVDVEGCITRAATMLRRPHERRIAAFAVQPEVGQRQLFAGEARRAQPRPRVHQAGHVERRPALRTAMRRQTLERIEALGAREAPVRDRQLRQVDVHRIHYTTPRRVVDGAVDCPRQPPETRTSAFRAHRPVDQIPPHQCRSR
jgi:hypothetical protein